MMEFLAKGKRLDPLLTAVSKKGFVVVVVVVYHGTSYLEHRFFSILGGGDWQLLHMFWSRLLVSPGREGNRAVFLF